MREKLEDIQSILTAASPYWGRAMLTAWGVCLLGWAVVFMLPGRYESHAKIYVDSSSLLEPLLKGLAVESDMANQAELVRRLLLSRPQIEKVVDETGLAKTAKNARQRDEIIAKTSERIGIVVEPQTRVFTITYENPDPAVAHAVVKTLLDSFVSQSLGGNRSDSESAQRFLTKQLKEYEERLIAGENRLADFKKKNVGLMPDERGGYFVRLQSEMQAAEQLRRDLSVAVEKRDALRRQSAGGTGAADAATAMIDSQIADAQTKLQNLLLRFTLEHPDVVAQQETISALRAQRNAVLSAPIGTSTLSSDLVSQNLRISSNQIEVEIASLRTQLSDRQKRVEDLRKMVNVLPEVEAEYTKLNRDYGVTRAEYEALLQRLETAKLSDQAGRHSETQIKVIDPPYFPVQTVSPNRQLLAAAVFFVGLGGGAALAWVLSILNPMIISPATLGKITTIPVVATLVELRTPEQIADRKSRNIRIGAGLGALVGAFAGVLVFARTAENFIRVMLG